MAKKKSRKPTKSTRKVTTKRKTLTRKRRSGHPFEINNVPTLI